MKWMIVAGTITMAAAACNAQGKKKTTDVDKPMNHTMAVDTPKVNVHVNKVYDKQGNLVRYDSTYTSVYNSMGGDSLRMDSLMQQFLGSNGEQDPWRMMGPEMNNLFFQDSLLGYDFFHNDFFSKRMDLNQQYMQNMMQRMDSLKNEFFRRQPAAPAK